MAMVNMNNLLNGKDSRWLQLEVCREFQRNKCSRPDTECKFAHPPANVEVQNGRVTACYDSIKGRCNREKPPCKYFHPPQHLKDQLLINGRNHLALKNALMQQMGLTPGQPLVPGQVQAVAANPYLTGMPQVGSTYSPYFAPGPIMPTIMGPDPTGVGSPLGVVPQTVVAQQKMPRSDRLEMDMKSVGSFYYDNFAFPGMMPYKRPAADKSGVPVYQPNATTYQQLMQLQQPFVPVSCEYSVAPAPLPTAIATTTSCASPVLKQDHQTVSTAAGQSVAAAVAAAAHAAAAAAAQTQNLNKVEQNDSAILGMSSQSSQTVAATPAAPTVVSSATASLPSHQVQQVLAHQQQANAAAAAAAAAASASIPDPAALAKEVAQQNYAKAVKLAAVSQSLATANQLGQQLNPLNYTGVALNKQALSMQHQAAMAARYPTSAAHHTLSPYGLNHLGLATANPYSMAAAAAAHQHQQNLLNMSRPPPQMFNPYSLVRASPGGYPVVTGASHQLLSNSFLGTVAGHGQPYPVTVSAAPMTMTNSVSASATIAAAAAQNNNNVVIQPYKKLKTT